MNPTALANPHTPAEPTANTEYYKKHVVDPPTYAGECARAASRRARACAHVAEEPRGAAAGPGDTCTRVAVHALHVARRRSLQRPAAAVAKYVHGRPVASRARDHDHARAAPLIIMCTSGNVATHHFCPRRSTQHPLLHARSTSPLITTANNLCAGPISEVHAASPIYQSNSVGNFRELNVTCSGATSCIKSGVNINGCLGFSSPGDAGTPLTSGVSGVVAGSTLQVGGRCEMVCDSAAVSSVNTHITCCSTLHLIKMPQQQAWHATG